MLKLSDNPPVTFPEAMGPREQAGRWWVARTKTRQEKLLAQNLLQWEIPYFLPMIQKTRRRQGRRFQSMLPLFSGYLFFCGSEEHRVQALTTNRIAQVLDVADQEGLVADLDQVHRAILAEVPIDPFPGLRPGIRCRVRSGPLLGIEGVILKKKNVTRLLLKIEILGQAASVEIDSELLDPLDG